MISDSSPFEPQHSPRESGSISIQDHMRAMANADSHSPVVQQPPGSAENNNNNSVGIQTGSKRSSVIDMWRQREMSLSCNNLNKPIPLRKTSSDRGIRHTEEKKELTLEEDVVDSESHEMVSNKRFSKPASTTTRRVFLPPTPRGASPSLSKPEAVVSPSTPAWDQPTNRNTWKDPESPLEDVRKRVYETVAAPCKEESPVVVILPESSNSWAGASSNVVHGRWDQTEQDPEELAKISPATSPKLVPVTRAAPVTPEDSETPAFNDLKSKWANFGAKKVQPRVGTKGPSNVVSPVVHKVTSDNSLRNTRSLGRGSDESSIDGDVTTGTQVQSNKMDLQGVTSATLLQEAKSQDHNTFEVPEETEKTSKRKSSRHETNSPQEEDSPAKKVATYMYMKGRPNIASKVSKEIDNNEIEDNGTFAPRLNALPKRMLQRKMLMDKQRRRSKGVGTSNSTYPSISNDEDALNEAFNKTCAEDETFAFPVKRAVTDPMRADNPTPMIKSRIPIQTLMAFGAAEDEFLAAESIPRKSAVHFPFNQQQQQQPKEEYGYRVSRIAADNTDEFASAPSPSPVPAQSAIAARAQKTLRDKRSRPKPSGGSPDRTSVPLKEPNIVGRSAPTASAPRGFTEDEMMVLDKEREGNDPPRAKPVIERSNGPSDEFKLSCGSRFWGGLNEPQPTATFDESVATSTTSHMLSLATSASDVTSVKDDHFDTVRSRDSLLDGDDLITDQFVSESNTHAEAFAASFQSLSLAQLANDIKEEAGSVLKGVNFKKFSSNWNEGVAAASQSLGEATSRLNKLVGKDVFAKVKPQPTVPGRAPSPVEEIAIEVEYVEDSDDGEG